MKRGLRGSRLALGLSCCAALALLAAGCGSSSEAGGARKLEVRAPVGSTYAYSIVTRMKAIGAAGEASFEGTLSEELKQVSGDNQIWNLAFKIDRANDSGVLKGAAASFKQMDGVTMERHSDSTGQPSKMVVNGVSVPSSGTSDLVYSKNPVKVGDTWESRIAAGGIDVGVTYKLDSYGKYEGKDAAKITGEYEKKVETVKPLVFWVDPKDGKMFSSTGSFRFKQGGSAVEVFFELKRISGP